MKRSKSQLRDELIGEAVLSLLRNRKPVNTKALTRQLRIMQAEEKDNEQQELLSNIITDMEAAVAPRGQDGSEVRLRERANGGMNGSEPRNSGKLH